MFEHEDFDVYSFDEIPLNEDCYVIDEHYIADYEQSLLGAFDGHGHDHGYPVGFVSARKINESSIDLTWYANFVIRFHEVTVLLPKEQFVACVGSSIYDEKPHIFVKRSWLEQLFSRHYSIFSLVDAIGVKDALQNGKLSRNSLIALRGKIDGLAARHTDISFISFADCLLLKSNWTVNHFENDVSYTYCPEVFISVIKDIQKIYKDVINLSVYAILTQGNNEYYENSLLHISESRNHVCLNSLGLPFAQLQAIEKFAREAIHKKDHEPSELYLDAEFFKSLRFKMLLDNPKKYPYDSTMMGKQGYYYCVSRDELLKNIKSDLDGSYGNTTVKL